MKEENKRTDRQSRAMHKYFEEVATELNNAGIDMRVLVKNLQVSHTKDSIKGVWKAIAEAKYGKKSTTELTTKEVDEVFDEFNKLLAEFDLHLPFPSNEYFIRENS